MSVVANLTGETINLNEVYAFLLEIVPKCGQVRLMESLNKKIIIRKNSI